MDTLNEGKGRCLATFRLLIRPVRAAIELGATRDVHSAVLRAVHHANRHGSAEDFVAIAFPAMKMGREIMLPGDDLELIGSDVSLGRLLELEGLMTLKRRGMLEETFPGEVYADEGMTGAAYVRDRAVEKHTAGWIRRSEARAARRGKPLGKAVKRRDDDLKSLVLIYGSTVLHIREVTGIFTDHPLFVSTYGFSSAADPAILPVFPDSARKVDDAD